MNALRIFSRTTILILYLRVLGSLLTLLILLPTPAAKAQGVVEKWVQRYNGPAGPGNNYDSATAVAVDGAGNVVVTGSSYGSYDDYYTAKYAATDGALMWEKRYVRLSSQDIARAIAVDGLGNVVVTGFSHGDWHTLKYAAVNGALLWEKRYSGPANAYDDAVAVAVDTFGNVVVTGTSAEDFYTVKYAAADGALLWEKRYNGPANGSDWAAAVTVDASDNVVVTGYSLGTSTYFDFYTAKYAAADGALLWEKRYNGPANSDDFASAMAVDGFGNVVVTGSSRSYFGDRDFYTVKYAAADGAPLWESRKERLNSQDEPSAVAVDGSGNVVVTGSFNGGGYGLISYTARYGTSDGTLLWEKYNYEESSTSSVAVDTIGNVVVTGTSYYDYYTAKYAASSGALLWEKRYNGPGDYQEHMEGRKQLALTPDGGVVVTGTSHSGTDYDYATVKYGPEFSLIESWRQIHFGTTSNSGNAADLFDFDKDGLVNLIEFAFGLNPTLGSLLLLPQAQRIGSDFVISFTQPAGVSGVTYGAEWSTTLSNNPADWSPVGDSDPSAEGYTFRVPISANERLFMRLKVTSS